MQKNEKITYYLKGFDVAFFNRFITYLRVKKEISDNTLKSEMGFFKSFLSWCIKNGYSTNLAFKDVTIKSRETSHVSLTTEEVDTLAGLELDKALSY